jgi:enoyl-CoA hydratase
MSAVSVAIDGHVAVITLDQPSTRNSLDADSATALVDICDALDANPDIGAAVIRGAGGTFCSGATRSLLARAGEDPAEAGRFDSVSAVYAAFTRVGELTMPSIAAMRGAAVGAGVNLLLATDLRIVATDARIVAGFQRIGIHPGGGHFSLLGRLAGREAAAAVGVFGEEISGTRARELNLAWDAVADSEVEDRALGLGRRVAADPELARRSIRSLRTQLGPPVLPWAAGVAVERAEQMWSLRRRHEARDR